MKKIKFSCKMIQKSEWKCYDLWSFTQRSFKIITKSLKPNFLKFKVTLLYIKWLQEHKENLKNISLHQIFKALFPCGSITGAPKLESIKFIEELEQRDRGIYCGTIGLIHKNKNNLA